MELEEALEQKDEARARLRAAWDTAMALLALVSLVPMLWVELEGVRWPEPRFQVLAAVDLLLVLVFAGDLAWGLWEAKDRRAWLRRHWYELPGLIPLYLDAVAWLRLAQVLRLTRLLRAFTGLRKLRTLAVLDVLVNRNKLVHTSLVSAGVVVGLATVVWLLERDTNPALARFDNALWWAIVTTTTVGYGDITPQTGLARLVATVLMLLGIGLIGVLASSFSAALIATGGAAAEQSEGPSAGPRRLVEELERLVALRERGLLTEAEFSLAKRKLLG
jgi:voltage-gated potassium channel